MKRVWLVLLSMVLVVALTTPVFAVDVKFSGEFVVGGMYLDKTTLKEDTATDGPSTAFYFQRLRVRTNFVVSPGLTLTTRFDALERAWGAARSVAGTTLDTQSSGTRAENENIAFDYAYVTYNSPIGIFVAGIQPNNTFGTIFGNSESPIAKITYTVPVGNFAFAVHLVKGGEYSRTAINPNGYADADNNSVYLIALYKRQNFEGGFLYIYNNDASKRPDTLGGYRMNMPANKLNPYFKAKLGPVDIQAELQYQRGEREFDDGREDITVEGLTGWVDATVNFDRVYFGATFAYVSGDDPGTKDIEGGLLNGGNDWNPCLILWNYDRGYWAGNLNGYGTSSIGTSMANAFFYQARAGVKPIDKLDIMVSVSYANADEKPTGFENDEYGWEVDLTGTYKITNNLSYMLGAGYLFTGDYFTGATNGNITDDFLVINKLTLIF